MPIRVVATVLVLAAVLAYLPGLSGGFLFDDEPNLTDNALVKIDGGNFDSWRTASQSSESGPLRRPIAMLTFAAQHAVEGGFDSISVKALSVLIHFLTAALVYLFSKLLLQAVTHPSSDETDSIRFIATLAVLIWLIHPLHVSTVLYAVQRMAQLSTLFTLLGLVVFLHYRQRWRVSGADTDELLAAALWLMLITLLAAYSKENGILLPALILVIEVTIFRGQWLSREHPGICTLFWLILALPLLALAVGYWIDPEWFASLYRNRNFTLEERLMTQTRLLWQYVGWFYVPDINAMGLHHDDIPISTGLFSPFSTIASLLAWVLTLVVVLVLRKRYPLLIFSVLFYLVGHSMESTFWPLEMVYEHRNYLPGVALALLLSTLVYGVLQIVGRENFKPVLLLIPAILLVPLLVRTSTWGDSFRLSQVNVVNHPLSSHAQHMYANALLERYSQAEMSGLSDQQRIDLLVDARFHFEQLHRQDPQYVAALVKLYELDSLYFPGLDDTKKWLARLERTLQTRALQSTDWLALTVLLDCWAKDYCKNDREGAGRIIEILERRYPDSSSTHWIVYGYLRASNAESTTIIDYLEGVVAAGTKDLRVHYALTRQYADQGMNAAAYEAVGGLMRADPHRRQLPAYRALFTAPQSDLH